MDRFAGEPQLLQTIGTAAPPPLVSVQEHQTELSELYRQITAG